MDPSTFNQSSEMERLVQVGTGAVESNAPLNVDRRNETASGISMIQSSALKRMRRTMWNIERQFLNPFITKAMYRYMQFHPSRYPVDYQFRIKGTMGIVAREFEQAQLIGMLSNIPPDSMHYNIVLQSIFELSTSPKRDQILKKIEQAQQPTKEQQQMQQIQQQAQIQMLQEQVMEAKLENEKTKAEIAKLTAEKLFIDKQRDLEDEKVSIQAANAVIGRQKVEVTAEQNRIADKKVEVERIKASKQGAKGNDNT